MSHAIARIVFASASLVLTCTLAVASASASTPEQAIAPHVRVRYADLDLGNAAGRQTLEHRLRSAANTVCIDAGTAMQAMICRSTALAQARTQLQRIAATAS